MNNPIAVLHLTTGKADLARGVVEGPDGVQIALTEQECALLRYLAARPNQDVHRDDLLTEVLGYKPGVISRAVDDAIKRLRPKVERIPSRPFHIVGLRGTGYRFVPLTVDAPARTQIQLGDATVDLDRLVVRSPERDPVSLSAQEGRLLELLAQHPGRPVPTGDLLREVWGIRDRRQRRLVDKLVYRLRGKLPAGQDGATCLQTVRGRGLMLQIEPTTSDMRDAAPQGRAPCPPPDTRPIGRESLIARSRDALERPGALVVLHGPAGAGKATIAREIAQSWRGTCLYADLRDAARRGELLTSLERAVGADDDPGEPGARLHAALQALTDPLLILEHAEVGAHELGALLAEVRRQAPNLRTLVTTRRLVAGSDTIIVDVGPLEADAARAVFIDRAARRGAVLDPDDERIDRIVQEVQALPLALELAASRVRLLGIEGLVARLDRPLDLLNPATAPGGLREALDRTWQILDEQDRDLLAACSVFRGPFSLEAAEVVLVHATSRPVLDGLQRLLDSAVLRTTADGRLAPYAGLSELVAERLGSRMAERVAVVMPRYVDRLAALAGPTSALREPEPSLYLTLQGELSDALVAVERGMGELSARGRVLAWASRVLIRLGQPNRAVKLLIAFGEPAGLPPEVRDALMVAQLVALAMVDPGRLDNLALDAADRAHAEGAHDIEAAAVGLLLSIGVANATPAQTAERRQRAQALLAADLDPIAEVTLRAGIGWAAFRAGDLDEAWAQHQDGLAIARLADAPWSVAAVALSLAGIAHFEGRLAEAETFITIARSPTHAMALPDSERESDDMLGLVRLDQGRLSEAEAIHRRLLERRRAAGDRYGLALQANRLGTIEGYRGDPRKAVHWFHQARVAFDLLRDRSRAAGAIYNIGECHRQDGRLDEAYAAFIEARDAFRALGRSTHEGIAIGQLGTVALARGDRAEAIPLLRDAHDLLERGRARARAAEVAATLAEATLDEDPSGALHAIRTAVHTLAESAAGPSLGIALCRHARIAHRLGHLDEALQAVAKATDLVRDLGLRPTSEVAQLLGRFRDEVG